ncbi:MAG: hypothetical protein ACRDS0_07840 [Pseudonocardiaceae bacterium]
MISAGGILEAADEHDFMINPMLHRVFETRSPDRLRAESRHK